MSAREAPAIAVTRLFDLLSAGAIQPPISVRIIREPIEVFASMSLEVVREFGETIVLSSVDGLDWRWAKLEPDGHQRDMGLTRDMLGWRPTGAPVGGWK